MTLPAEAVLAAIEQELASTLTPGGSPYPRLPRERMLAAIERALPEPFVVVVRHDVIDPHPERS